jgi:adenylylsulfate kinase
MHKRKNITNHYSMPTNIHPQIEETISRKEKEHFLNQRGLVIWFTGLSGSGKSTLAFGLAGKLHEKGYLTQVLDGDIIRKGINNNLGFSMEDRNENIRRIAEVANLFLNCGIITICAFISPTIAIRDMAKSIIGKENLYNIYLSTPLEICEQRDEKGLYKKARDGEIKEFTGINSPYEKPPKPDLQINTDKLSVSATIEYIMGSINPLIKR